MQVIFLQYLINWFQEKRNDKEVDALFAAIENLVEIKDTELGRFEPVGTHLLQQTNEDLIEALNICTKFCNLEEKYTKVCFYFPVLFLLIIKFQDSSVEDLRTKRKVDWDNFMQGITTKYTDINNSFELKEEELKQLFDDIEKKLFV